MAGITRTRRLGVGRRFTVEVTDKMIALSERRNSAHCMVAEAVRESLIDLGVDPKFIAVDIATIRFSDIGRGYRYTYLTPRIAQVALIAFDAGKHTEPFSFQLRVAQVTKMGRQRSGSNKQTMRTRTARDTSGAVPIREGGKAPPSAGLRRAYGVRALRA